MSNFNVRLEVMKSLEDKINGFIDKYLLPVEEMWQPTDLLPNSNNDNFEFEITKLREESKELGYDFWVVMVGDTVTEEALPTYESWLMDVEGINQKEGSPWAKWLRFWTGEENRHGDVLNKYLYLSGRVDMREVEVTTHHLLNDGFDPGTDRDPYRNFIYTSFQELATHISHKRVAQIALKQGNAMLSKMCMLIAGDEMRHHLAYRDFVKQIIPCDPNELLIAFEDMMRKKIIMPANNIRESGGKIGDAFVHFSDSAQRLGVYTGKDYVSILEKLLKFWEIDKLESLNAEGEKARDYLMNLPARLTRIMERNQATPEPYQFKWVKPNGMMV